MWRQKRTGGQTVSIRRGTQRAQLAGHNSQLTIPNTKPIVCPTHLVKSVLDFQPASLKTSGEGVRGWADHSFQFLAIQQASERLPVASIGFKMAIEEDPYLNLEDAEGAKGIEFAKLANQMCLKALGDPTTSSSSRFSRILSTLESDDRIPFVSKMGTDDNGDHVLYNLWKDPKVGHGVSIIIILVKLRTLTRL